MIEKSTSSIDRNVAEARFHDELRGERSGDERYQANDKYYYSVGKSSQQFVKGWIGERCKGKKVLDYCCGNGEFTRFLAQAGADAYGIDISPVSVDNARKAAAQQGLANCATFEVLNAEATEFPDNYFDYVHIDGVLHHLDLATSYRRARPNSEARWRGNLPRSAKAQSSISLIPEADTASQDGVGGRAHIREDRDLFGDRLL